MADHTICVDEVTVYDDTQQFDIVFSQYSPPTPFINVIDIDSVNSFVNIHDIKMTQTGITYRYDVVVWYSYKSSENSPVQKSIVSKSSTQIYSFPSAIQPCKENLNASITATITPTYTANTITASITSAIRYNKEECILLVVQGTKV